MQTAVATDVSASLSGTKGEGNLLLKASLFFTGIHFDQCKGFSYNTDLKTICEDTYTTLRKTCVFPVVERAECSLS